MRTKNALLAIVGFLMFSATTPAGPQNDRGGPDEEAVDRGEAVYTYWCATCHSAGPGMPGTAALEAKYRGSVPAVLRERTDLTSEMIGFYVRNGVSVMPPFRKTEISDADLEALANYVIDASRPD